MPVDRPIILEVKEVICLFGLCFFWPVKVVAHIVEAGKTSQEARVVLAEAVAALEVLVAEALAVVEPVEVGKRLRLCLVRN